MNKNKKYFSFPIKASEMPTEKTNIKSENTQIDFKANKKDNKLISKKIKRPHSKIKKEYPGITYFNLDSHFIYDLSKPKDLILAINNKNTIKLNKKEVKRIQDEITIIYNLSNIKIDENYISIKYDEYNSINEYFHIDENQDSITKWVNNYIFSQKERDKISLQKITQVFKNDTGDNISKTKMFYIFKNKLKLNYLKTSVKNSKIKSNNYVFLSLCFIKIIVKAISLGFTIYYMDESDISLRNNNFRCWRKQKEYIYHDYGKNERSNLLLIVDKNSVIHYKINNQATNEETFLVFMKDFLKKIKEINKN